MSSSKSAGESAYHAIIVKVFFDHWTPKATEFEFDRSEIAEAAKELGMAVPKNLGDVIYTFRYRRNLPQRILETQPNGLHWLILGAGAARYRFRLSRMVHIQPRSGLLIRKIPDSTPEIISHRAMNDEQALLAKIRYNRLIDIFLGIAAYSLQNHLRTTIENYGQIEIDELYVGVDSQGTQFIVPVQAKGGKDKLGVIQTIQDVIFCKSEHRYSDCVARPVSAQFLEDDKIALFELTFDGNDVSIVRERHYQLTSAERISAEDLSRYRLTDPD